MPGRISLDSVQLDDTTSRAVAHGIGERLRQSIGSEAHFPDRLQKLLDAMREQETRASDAKSTTS